MAGLIMRLLHRIERSSITPGCQYQWAQTEFVREHMRVTPWEQHQYIDDLIKLELDLRNGSKGGIIKVIDMLRHKYPDEYVAIAKEVEERGLRTSEYARELAKLAKRHEASQAELAKERAQEAQEAAEDLIKQRETWFKMGGKP